jgi:hypothetical protein
VTAARRLRHGVLAGGLVVLAAANGICAAAGVTTREALIARWSAANHRPARLLETSAPFARPPPGLRTLAARELAMAGRYRLAPSPPAVRPNRPWWLRAFDWLRDRWTALWSAAFGRARLGRGGAVVIGDLLIAGAVLLVLFVGYRLLAGLAFDRRSGAGRFETLASPVDPRALFAAADERARRGEYAAASRLLFAATIAALAGRGAVRDDRSATVGDFRRVLRQCDAGLVPSFDAVSSAFVTAAYAERPVEALQWERARLAYLSVLAGRPEP